MQIVWQVLSVLQTAGIPLLAVIMAVVVMNMVKEAGKTTATDENDFKVTEGSFWMVIAGFGIVAAAFFIWMASGRSSDSQRLVSYVIAVICLVMTIVTGFIYKHHYLMVEGDTLTYQPKWGKKQSYDVKKIGRMEIIQNPNYQQYRFFNKTGQKLFEVQGYMKNTKTLAKYVNHHPIHVVKLDSEDPKVKKYN